MNFNQNFRFEKKKNFQVFENVKSYQNRIICAFIITVIRRLRFDKISNTYNKFIH